MSTLKKEFVILLEGWSGKSSRASVLRLGRGGLCVISLILLAQAVVCCVALWTIWTNREARELWDQEKACLLARIEQAEAQVAEFAAPGGSPALQPDTLTAALTVETHLPDAAPFSEPERPLSADMENIDSDSVRLSDISVRREGGRLLCSFTVLNPRPDTQVSGTAECWVAGGQGKKMPLAFADASFRIKNQKPMQAGVDLTALGPVAALSDATLVIEIRIKDKTALRTRVPF